MGMKGRILTDDGKVIVAGDVAFDETKGGAQRPGPASVSPKEHVRVAVDRPQADYVTTHSATVGRRRGCRAADQRICQRCSTRRKCSTHQPPPPRFQLQPSTAFSRTCGGFFVPDDEGHMIFRLLGASARNGRRQCVQLFSPARRWPGSLRAASWGVLLLFATQGCKI